LNGPKKHRITTGKEMLRRKGHGHPERGQLKDPSEKKSGQKERAPYAGEGEVILGGETCQKKADRGSHRAKKD